MVAPRRLSVTLSVFGGDFASQPLAFAHMLDTCPEIDLDAVDVLQGDIPKRLKGYFNAAERAQVERGLGARDTCIVVAPGAGRVPEADTAHLTWLGRFPGHIIRVEAAP